MKSYRLTSVAPHPQGLVPLPNKLVPFVWHFAKQAWQPMAVVMVLAGLAVMLGQLAPWFYARAIGLFNQGQEVSADQLITLLGLMVATLYVAQPLLDRTARYLAWPMFFVHFRERVRYQVVIATRAQSLSFFNEDLAGRLASKAFDTGMALAEICEVFIIHFWGFAVALVVAGVLLFKVAPVLLVVFVIWFVCYVVFLRWMIPIQRKTSRIASDLKSRNTGLVVDNFANILLVKLFGRDNDEDSYLRDKAQEAADASQRNHHNFQMMWVGMACLTFLLSAPTMGLTFYGWQHGWFGKAEGLMAMTVLPQVIQFSWWVAESSVRLLENIATVDDAIEALAKPYTVVDAVAAPALVVKAGGGTVTFQDVFFNYGKADKSVGDEGAVLHGLNLTIPAGQKVGLVGRSGAGKSTMASLLLRFYDLERGTIIIDGQDISKVTQASLRQHIGMVTQEAHMMHRSVADNIRLGKPNATDEEVIAAAKRAHAHAFIILCEDKNGRKGYEAHVGERGVKLSGGQRQRIAIARMILENAPILLLDEATSALDSEVEAAIQEEMATLMVGKTTIAIAHRLSTIAQMDRLVVMDRGRIVEDGTHAELLARGGIYADLWSRQSGGFIGHD